MSTVSRPATCDFLARHAVRPSGEPALHAVIVHVPLALFQFPVLQHQEPVIVVWNRCRAVTTALAPPSVPPVTQPDTR